MRKIKPHTLQKLKYFEKYLKAYLVVTKRLPKKYYVDAFAGCGKCIIEKTKKIVDGSSLIALLTENAFDGYMLIEQTQKNFKELQTAISKANIHEERLNVTKLYNEDCNELLKKVNFNNSVGYLVFLDPVGPESLWKTIASLSKIRKMDLLILYPYDMSLVRLTKDYPEQLDKFYGTNEWFDIYENRTSAADSKKKLLDLYINNLRKLGFEFVIYKQIRTRIRAGNSLYHLLLATHSPIGKKIMSEIFDKELDGQKKLKLN